jgi:hypothetical protein
LRDTLDSDADAQRLLRHHQPGRVYCPAMAGAQLFADVVSIDPFQAHFRPGAGAGFVVLVSFLVSYLGIRTSARMTRSVSWWPGGVETGGVHIHHLVWGIGLLLLCGFLAFAAPLDAPWWHVIAIGFGIGAGFTLDEFALWVRLEDVYWSEEGRMSFDAVLCTLAFGALVVLGTRPFGLDEPASVWGTAGAALSIGALCCVAFAKGRVVLGVIGLFLPLAAIVAAVRLAHPSSPWAKWRYRGAKLERAKARFAPDSRVMRVRRRIGDAVAGAPSQERTGGDG